MDDKIIHTIKKGGFVAVADDVRREHEVDLVIAATAITVPQMAFMIQHTSGIICIAMEQQRLRTLKLQLLPTKNPANFRTPFTMPVDFKPVTRGGVSAKERIATIRALVNPATTPEDLGRPGHVFPLQAHKRGLQGRNGHTEAALELMKRAEQYPAAVLAELLNDNGTLMRGKILGRFLHRYHIPFVHINTLISTMT